MWKFTSPPRPGKSLTIVTPQIVTAIFVITKISPLGYVYRKKVFVIKILKNIKRKISIFNISY